MPAFNRLFCTACCKFGTLFFRLICSVISCVLPRKFWHTLCVCLILWSTSWNSASSRLTECRGQQGLKISKRHLAAGISCMWAHIAFKRLKPTYSLFFPLDMTLFLTINAKFSAWIRENLMWNSCQLFLSLRSTLWTNHWSSACDHVRSAHHEEWASESDSSSSPCFCGWHRGCAEIDSRALQIHHAILCVCGMF